MTSGGEYLDESWLRPGFLCTQRCWLLLFVITQKTFLHRCVTRVEWSAVYRNHETFYVTRFAINAALRYTSSEHSK